LVLPGYACTVALFPVADRHSSVVNPSERRVTRLERAVLSVGFSIALVVLAGVVLDAAVGRLTTTTLLAAMGILTVGLAAAAAVRRRRVPAEIRYVPTLERAAARVGPPDAVTILLVASLLFAGGAIAAPNALGGGSDGVTELYFLSEADDGSLQAGDYPTELTRGSPQPISVAVGNRGDAAATYTLVGQLQRVDREGNGTVVRERRQLPSGEVRVGAGETRIFNETVTAEETGSYRLVYLLYRGDAPSDPRIDNAYREVHLWLTVTEGDS
jgi:uncharacterized membrane protein